MQKKILFKKGFSLIELLTVISIMTVLFSLGYANYRDFQRRQHLESAVRMVKADLRLAQEMALAGRKPDICGTSDLLGYSFEINESNDTYSIIADCRDGATEQVKLQTLPEGVEIESVVSDDNFRFNVLGQGTDETSEVGIGLSFPSGGVDPTGVIITPVGEIKIGLPVPAGPLIVLNESSNSNCSDICSMPENGGRTCGDVGTDSSVAGNDRRVRWISWFGGFCWPFSWTDCGTSMSSSNSHYCGVDSDFHNTNWTYCQCE